MKAPGTTYEIRPWGALAGVILGAGAGALLTAVALYGRNYVEPLMAHKASATSPWMDMFWALATISLFVFFLFLAGLVLIGCPAWLFLHQRGLRRPLHAVVTGATLCGLAALGLTELLGGDVFGRIGAKDFNAPAPPHIIAALEGTALMALIGGLVGLLIWRLAYRRVDSAHPAG